ncbi:MAG: hypothetical protein NTY04_02095 [Candidatus Staskawiczbacteria bacterium]|nr:hypothetical protein [Candidatus Staskawiczbacteria bacterium]
MIKNKKLLFIFFVAAFMFLSSGFAYAAMEVVYPKIPGLITPTASCSGSNCLGVYAAYIFGIFVYIAGIISVISFTMGAIGLINPALGSHQDAKDRMIGSIMGLVLTLASFIIIHTINPKLTVLKIASLPGTNGVFYTNGKEQKPCPEENADVSTIPQGFNNIIYCCSPDCKSTSGPALLVWMFPNTGFNGTNGKYSGVDVERVTCNKKIAISGKSFQMSFESPGVYFYLGKDCSGYGSESVLNSQDLIQDPFKGSLKSIRIVNDTTNDLLYGAIFHKEQGLENGGTCSKPLINATTDGCQAITGGFCCNVNIAASAVDVFQMNKSPRSSGDGVSFYSEPYGWDAGANAGFYVLASTKISYPYYQEDANTMAFDYTNVDRPAAYEVK